MLNWVIFLGGAVLLQVANLVLRRFKAGRQVIKVLGLLHWLFLIGIWGELFGFGERLRVPITEDLSLNFHWFILLWFIKEPITILYQSILQLLGDGYIKLANKGKMPTQGNYVQKGQYILPFIGQWTVFNGGCDENLRHGGSVSQTYAYDFIIMDEGGQSFAGSNTALDSYYCYARDVLAPGDGEVVAVKKNCKDSFVDGVNAYCDALDIRGNYITIRHHENEYSVLAHLMPGSEAVKVGDMVKQGQAIAKCGNSGNSSEPHLHFQFQSGKSFFFSMGLPIGFSGIAAGDKVNYKIADTRPRENNLQIVGDKTYIGRGLAVENNKSFQAGRSEIAEQFPSI